MLLANCANIYRESLMSYTEEQKARKREYMKNRRAVAKASGVILASDKPIDRKEYGRNYMRQKRAEAREAGVDIPSDIWWKENPEKHNAKTSRWRATNFEKSQQINRNTQARRRSTPWGEINNRMWPMLHYSVRARSVFIGKYTIALGYTWLDLAIHLESQFTPEMNWSNWGDVWELDHIKPLNLFRYESIECPTFKEAWSLSNLRPLLRELNQKKGWK